MSKRYFIFSFIIVSLSLVLFSITQMGSPTPPPSSFLSKPRWDRPALNEIQNLTEPDLKHVIELNNNRQHYEKRRLQRKLLAPENAGALRLVLSNDIEGLKSQGWTDQNIKLALECQSELLAKSENVTETNETDLSELEMPQNMTEAQLKKWKIEKEMEGRARALAAYQTKNPDMPDTAKEEILSASTKRSEKE